MERLNVGDFSVPSLTENYDWVAITQLQNQLHKSQNNFRIEALESALQKAVLVNRRISSGLQLAKDLYRDGRKKARFLNRFVYIDDDAGFDETVTVSNIASEKYNHEKTISTITIFFRSLKAQERKALVVALLGLKNDKEQVKLRLGIGIRQLWNILDRIQNQIKGKESLRAAFSLALSNWSLKPSDFISLIEEN